MDGENPKGKYERVQVTHCNDVYNTGVVHSPHQMSYLFTVVTLNCTETSSLSKVGYSLLVTGAIVLRLLSTAPGNCAT